MQMLNDGIGMSIASDSEIVGPTGTAGIYIYNGFEPKDPNYDNWKPDQGPFIQVIEPEQGLSALATRTIRPFMRFQMGGYGPEAGTLGETGELETHPWGLVTIPKEEVKQLDPMLVARLPIDINATKRLVVDDHPRIALPFDHVSIIGSPRRRMENTMCALVRICGADGISPNFIGWTVYNHKPVNAPGNVIEPTYGFTQVSRVPVGPWTDLMLRDYVEIFAINSIGHQVPVSLEMVHRADYFPYYYNHEGQRINVPRR